jgi:hypothetical protein
MGVLSIIYYILQVIARLLSLALAVAFGFAGISKEVSVSQVRAIY